MSAHVDLFNLGKPRVTAERGGCRITSDLTGDSGPFAGLGILHFDDAGALADWLAEACEGLSALLDPCGGGDMPRADGPVDVP